MKRNRRVERRTERTFVRMMARDDQRPTHKKHQAKGRKKKKEVGIRKKKRMDNKRFGHHLLLLFQRRHRVHRTGKPVAFPRSSVKGGASHALVRFGRYYLELSLGTCDNLGIFMKIGYDCRRCFDYDKPIPHIFWTIQTLQNCLKNTSALSKGLS